MRVIVGVFAVIGLGLFIGGMFAYRHTRHFVDTAISAQGVVTANVRSQSTAGRTTFHPRVRFRTADGQEISFISSIGTRPPVYRVNDPVRVLYDPQDPYHASIQSLMNLWILPIILCGLGIFFGSAGVVAAVLQIVGARRKAWLQQNGRRILAQFTRVELNKSVRVNGLHPYIMVCQWLDPASNRMQVFKSANIWFDPSSYISAKTLEVLVDPDNSHRYLVDTSFLPKVG